MRTPSKSLAVYTHRCARLDSVEVLSVEEPGLVALAQVGVLASDDLVAPDVVQLGQDEQKDIEAAEPSEAFIRGVVCRKAKSAI